VGHDAALVTAKTSAAKFARTDLPVLLLAETGTGKELFARAIHAGSARAKGPFVAINCGAIPETLVASELFGHGAGAFTGARAQGQSGRVAAAAGGTLFLDEIAELPLSAQAALLRFLEDGTFRRVGETEERRVDVRLVCATCRDLGAMVESGSFRRDLFFRIKGARLTLPALRDRSDVRELVAELLVRVAPKGRRFVLSPEAADTLVRHEWPGNVRELKTALQYATALAEDGEIRVEHLPEDVMTEAVPRSANGHEAQEATPSRRLAEREALRMALDRARGNMSEAARQLGVARSTLYRMIVRHGVS
jgi:transcriptional regulator with PAS, ATPase and Fis domain